MVIGNGQLAQVFKGFDSDEVCVFASGVSDSNCTDEKNFERERNLLKSVIETNRDKKICYFSSCALSSPEYPKNEYYHHKQMMEELIKQNSKKYYIFRIPQLFGNLIQHKTLINFIYNSIKFHQKFYIYDGAYRYVIEINDVKKLVEAYLNFSESCITIDLSNPYRYYVLDIVKTIENILHTKADYELVKKEDSYTLDLSKMETFIKKNNIEMSFGKNYLLSHLNKKIEAMNRVKP